jgi:hypothetical protein
MDPEAMDPARLREKFENPSLMEFAFRRHFLVLVFVVYVTRPVVVTAAVYDEQSIYYFMSPCKLAVAIEPSSRVLIPDGVLL